MYTLSGKAVLFVLAMGAAAATGTDPIAIESRRELFVDNTLIDQLDGTRLMLQRPVPAGAAIQYDSPWEDELCFYTTILKDGHTYRMYYRGLYGEQTCYAESPDGIQWTKPDLGLVKVNGSSANNIILVGARSFCPFIDDRPGVPKSARYKANIADRDHEDGGLYGYVSADGIHWKKMEHTVLVGMKSPSDFDAQNVMFWSEAENCYVVYARHLEGGRRATMRATSQDFLHWTPTTLMTYSDTQSTTPSAHLYTNQTTPYFRAPHIYISLPGRIFFNHLKSVVREDDKKIAGTRTISEELRTLYKEKVSHEIQGGIGDYSDGVLLVTRAGTTHYDFTFRESFIRPGIGLENWVTRTNYPACGVVPTGPHEMSLYVQRHYGQKTGYLQRMTLRLDGFASVHAPFDGGEMLTKPFTFSGNRLEINYSTSAAGSVSVEIQQPDHTPIPGFTLQECVKLMGDQISQTVSWQAGSKLSSLAGGPIRLRFVMKDADLFSLRFSEKIR